MLNNKLYKIQLLVFVFFVSFGISYATGLMMPVAKGYPKDFLRLKTCEITVNIHGLVAETVVYQEFQNEWSDSTDAVYSFPLPENARATNFIYWYNDKAYKAVLQVKEQSTNPGTGEGGVAAEVNKYIGKNGIKIYLKGIKAGMIQRVELHYISLCEYYKGRSSYIFPLNTGSFIKYPLDNVKFTVKLSSGTPVTKYNMEPYSDFKVTQDTSDGIKAELFRSKMYIDQDIRFTYEKSLDKLGVDFFSAANDTTEGHFVLFARPQDQVSQDSVIKKCVIFAISNSMSGVQLESGKSAVTDLLGRLSPKDYFNIAVFNYNFSTWNSVPVAATAANIDNARKYVSAISSSWGSRMQEALQQCLSQLKDSTFSNSIMVFTESGANADPVKIENLNNLKAGIFPIGIGDQVNRSRLEMTAALNYGFTTYIGLEDNFNEKVVNVFNQISQPILKDVRFEYGKADISQVVPQKIPTTYAGSYFYIAGRYKNPGISPLSIAGNSATGTTAFDFRLNFSSDKTINKFCQSLWAKEMIDALERQIEVYGETQSLKQQLINLSLQYNIRCRYTAYIADYKTPSTSVQQQNSLTIPVSYIAGNYPNPFNPTTRIRLFLDNSSAGKIKYLKIFNILGQLVAVIDLTSYMPGWNEVHFNGRDINGSTLPSGIYIVRLEVGDRIESTIRINLIK